MGYVRRMRRVSPGVVVGAFAALRVAIGAVFMIAPDRVAAPSERSPGATLMTRSFAVREAVLGVGGLLAVARQGDCLPAIRTWAGLGALTDLGDLVASLAEGKGGDTSVRVPALVAAAGLCGELWALTAPASVSTTAQVT